MLENAVAQVGSADQNAIKSAIGQFYSTVFHLRERPRAAAADVRRVAGRQVPWVSVLAS